MKTIFNKKKKIASFYLGIRFLSLQRMLQLLRLCFCCSFLLVDIQILQFMLPTTMMFSVFQLLALEVFFSFSLKYSFFFSQNSLLFCSLLHPTSFSLPSLFNTSLLSFTVSVLENYQRFFQMVVMVSFLYISSFKFSLKSYYYEEQNQYSNSIRVMIEESLQCCSVSLNVISTFF